MRAAAPTVGLCPHRRCAERSLQRSSFTCRSCWHPGSSGSFWPCEQHRRGTLKAAGLQPCRDAAYLLGKNIATLYRLRSVPPLPGCLARMLPA